MIESEPGSSKRSNVLRDILEEIEVLRIARQEEVRDRPHPFLKRFTQQELTDEACPTYKNLLVGRSQRIPSRQTLMQIADYLECGIAQRNNLLLAARYLPESLELAGSELWLALEQARHLMGTLPYPAMLVTHTLDIEAINELFQSLFAFPPLTAIPRAQRHENWSNSSAPSPISVNIGRKLLRYSISTKRHQSYSWAEMPQRENCCRSNSGIFASRSVVTCILALWHFFPWMMRPVPYSHP
jgi:hypothetical protein